MLDREKLVAYLQEVREFTTMRSWAKRILERIEAGYFNTAQPEPRVCPECKGNHVQNCGYGSLTCMDCQWIGPTPMPKVDALIYGADSRELLKELVAVSSSITFECQAHAVEYPQPNCYRCRLKVATAKAEAYLAEKKVN